MKITKTQLDKLIEQRVQKILKEDNISSDTHKELHNLQILISNLSVNRELMDNPKIKKDVNELSKIFFSIMKNLPR